MASLMIRSDQRSPTTSRATSTEQSSLEKSGVRTPFSPSHLHLATFYVYSQFQRATGSMEGDEMKLKMTSRKLRPAWSGLVVRVTMSDVMHDLSAGR